jgi:hypothetical protein
MSDTFEPIGPAGWPPSHSALAQAPGFDPESGEPATVICHACSMFLQPYYDSSKVFVCSEAVEDGQSPISIKGRIEAVESSFECLD